MNTIRHIIEDSSLLLDDTVYNESEMLDFEMPTVGSWSIHTEDPDKSSFAKMIEYRKARDRYASDEGIDELVHREDKLTASVTEMILGGALPKSPKVLELGREKARIRKEKKRILASASRKALDDVFSERVGENGISSVYFKDSLVALPFSELQSCNERWKGEAFELLEKRPWFVRDLSELRRMLEKKGPVGIEGGACLFGSDEMRFIFRMKNGDTRVFDFNVMQEIKKGHVFSPVSSTELHDFIQSEGGDIESASIDCPKKQLTIDEYEVIVFIFLLAGGLDAKVVVTIPDISYDKTFISLFSSLDESIFRPFHESFLSECHRMCSVTVNMIDGLAKVFSFKDYEIFYSGNEERCRLFEEKKGEFLSKYRKKHKLTTRDWMTPALMDYICMPAMPYYFYGTENVIEVNRLEESPSIEKCRSIHHTSFDLYEILYPQKMGKNGRTSGFYSAFDEKEFIV